MAYRIGSVPYVNARPLVQHFLSLGKDSPVELSFYEPSELAVRLRAGEFDAALVSSIVALEEGGRYAVEGLGIVSSGRVQSVKLFSKVPLEKVRTLSPDPASRTSNRLAEGMIVRAGGRPTLVELEGTLEERLNEAEAAVIIGDSGYKARLNTALEFDLGELWKRETNLPFVWALWASYRPIPAELCGFLHSAHRWSLEHLNMVVEEAATASGWSHENTAEYLSNAVSFKVGTEEIKGLGAYCELPVSESVELGLPHWCSELSLVS